MLLVGETGTGKTALVQQMATLVGAPLVVVNLSNQSESADFLGGFRPAGARHLCLPLLPKFTAAFERTFPSAANAEFLQRVQRYAERRKWTHMLHAFRAGVERVAALTRGAAEGDREGEGGNRDRGGEEAGAGAEAEAEAEAGAGEGSGGDAGGAEEGRSSPPRGVGSKGGRGVGSKDKDKGKDDNKDKGRAAKRRKKAAGAGESTTNKSDNSSNRKKQRAVPPGKGRGGRNYAMSSYSRSFKPSCS